MSGFLDQFRNKVLFSLRKDQARQEREVAVDDKIALGVLLWVVAQADDRFLPEEKEKIEDILRNYAKISEKDMPVILASIEQAEKERIDLHTFTREVSHGLSYPTKVEITELLFRLACVDGDLAHEEHEQIRQIAGLFQIDHKDFINAKIKVKKESGMDTVD
ncbi:MAG: TerB family tellurite resistance protein [Candidatus Omnitrophica bacterium]|nr:TerB family tellurite resistance protein [Candidatus Omnitrophota bacterium]